MSAAEAVDIRTDHDDVVVASLRGEIDLANARAIGSLVTAGTSLMTIERVSKETGPGLQAAIYVPATEGGEVRAGMTAERLDALLARQMADGEKRRRAHFIVDSSRSFDSARAQVLGILRAVSALPGRRIG